MPASRIFAALAVALFALASAGPASALSLTPANCPGDCYGVDIELDVTLTSVQLMMDFQNYVGTVPAHDDLEAIAFKLYTTEVVWTPAPGNPFDDFTNGGLNSNGCSDSGNGWDCFAGNFDIIAAGKPTLTLDYTITGATALLGAGDSSFKAKFGPQDGWLISESMIPEPTGAALFLVGGVVMSSGIRRRRA
jgi:hypothetical protein